MELSEAIGANARAHRKRHGVTLDDVAKVARSYGLRWTSSRTGDFESGRVSSTIGTVVAACMAYSEATGDPLTVDAVLSTEHRLDLTSELRLTADRLKEILSGGNPTPLAGDTKSPDAIHEVFAGSVNAFREAAAKFPDVDMRTLKSVEEHSGLATSRLAADLETSVQMINAASASLWNRSVEDERDSRAGEHATPQRRGHIMRTLKSELKQAIGGVHGDNREL